MRARVLLTLVAAAAALSLGPPAAADCTGPEITLSPRRAAPGDEVTVAGHGWGDACNDTPGPVCNPPTLGDPIQNIRLELDGVDLDGVDLGTFDADDEYSFETTIEVPQLTPGRYVLRAKGDGGRTSAILHVSRN